LWVRWSGKRGVVYEIEDTETGQENKNEAGEELKECAIEGVDHDYSIAKIDFGSESCCALLKNLEKAYF
jgi:hypothetical protein